MGRILGEGDVECELTNNLGCKFVAIRGNQGHFVEGSIPTTAGFVGWDFLRVRITRSQFFGLFALGSVRKMLPIIVTLWVYERC